MKIALLGSAPHSVNLAPFKDQSWNASRQGIPPSPFRLEPYVDDTWEIWGVSPGAFAHAQRASRWFEVHRWEPGQPWFGPEYVQFLRDFRGPVYTGGVIPEIRNHVVYPIERVEEEFSAYFLHSSLSLMAAMAILEIEDMRKLARPGDMVTLNSGGPTMRVECHAAEAELVECAWPDPATNGNTLLREAFHPQMLTVHHRAGNPTEPDVIGFWGVDMAANEEYGDQRSGCHFFILEALRRGIEVFVPPESCLLRPKPIYGLSEWSHDYIKMTAKQRDWNMRKQHYTAQLQEAQNHLQALQGASGELEYMVNTWTSPYGLPSGLRVKMTDGKLGGGITLPRPPGQFIANYDSAMEVPEMIRTDEPAATPLPAVEPAKAPVQAKKRARVVAKAKRRR